MHEFSMAADIVEAAVTAADGRGLITAVHVELGAESHLDPGILTDAFEMAATGTAAAGAKLRLNPADGRIDLAVVAVDVDE